MYIKKALPIFLYKTNLFFTTDLQELGICLKDQRNLVPLHSGVKEEMAGVLYTVQWDVSTFL